MSQLRYISITQSQLYRIGRKKDIAALMGLSLSELKRLTSDSYFKEWTKEQKGKKRLIEEPAHELEVVLSRLHSILKRVETPDWLMSGKRKVKPQDNATAHKHNPYMITVDIEEFYQSTKREYIYTAFKNLFGQTSDVASLLADLVTYKGHIPTGAATSQLMAFWAYRPTFERLHKLCTTKGIIMTVWVDDITFSSLKPFPINWVADVKKIVQEVQLSLKMTKTKNYTSDEYKSTTGSAISPEGDLRVKNQKRKEIIDLLKNKKVEFLQLKEAKSLFGKLVSQRQTETDFFDNVYFRLKKRVRKLEKANTKILQKQEIK